MFFRIVLTASTSVFWKIIMWSFFKHLQGRFPTAYVGALQQVSICNSNSEKWYRSLISNDLETGHVTCIVSYVTEAVFARAVVFGFVEWKFTFELMEIDSSRAIN